MAAGVWPTSRTASVAKRKSGISSSLCTLWCPLQIWSFSVGSPFSAFTQHSIRSVFLTPIFDLSSDHVRVSVHCTSRLRAAFLSNDLHSSTSSFSLNYIDHIHTH